MSDIELVDHVKNGTSEYAHFDADGNLTALQWQRDVEHVIDYNKRAQNDGTRGYGPTREWRHIGEIPDIMFLKWAEIEGVHPSKAWSREFFRHVVKKYRYDPDYRYLWTV